MSTKTAVLFHVPFAALCHIAPSYVTSVAPVGCQVSPSKCLRRLSSDLLSQEHVLMIGPKKQIILAAWASFQNLQNWPRQQHVRGVKCVSGSEPRYRTPWR